MPKRTQTAVVEGVSEVFIRRSDEAARRIEIQTIESILFELAVDLISEKLGYEENYRKIKAH